MDSKKVKPSAMCNKCYLITSDVGYAGQQCYKRIEGKRCRGTFEFIPDDKWKECPICSGIGRIERKSCSQCQGFGWLYNRLG